MFITLREGISTSLYSQTQTQSSENPMTFMERHCKECISSESQRRSIVDTHLWHFLKLQNFLLNESSEGLLLHLLLQSDLETESQTTRVLLSILLLLFNTFTCDANGIKLSSQQEDQYKFHKATKVLLSIIVYGSVFSSEK